MSLKPVKNYPRAEDDQLSDAADRQLDAAGHNIHFDLSLFRLVYQSNDLLASFLNFSNF